MPRAPGHNYHPSRVPGRTKFLTNLEYQRTQAEEEKRRALKKKGMVKTVKELFS